MAIYVFIKRPISSRRFVFANLASNECACVLCRVSHQAGHSKPMNMIVRFIIIFRPEQRERVCGKGVHKFRCTHNSCADRCEMACTGAHKHTFPIFPLLLYHLFEHLQINFQQNIHTFWSISSLRR